MRPERARGIWPHLEHRYVTPGPLHCGVTSPGGLTALRQRFSAVQLKSRRTPARTSLATAL